jgi:hypothetical protein
LTVTGLERHRSAGACRACGGHDLDLGAQPPAERLVRPEEADRPDAVFPLRILLCPTCFLVQLDGEPIESDNEPGGLAFSVSPTMRAHIRGFVDDALRRTNSTAHLRVVEMASHANRLHELLAATGVASMLIEPVPRYAAAARAAGEPPTNARLTEKVAAEIVRAGGQADLVVDAFYLAHDASPPDYAAGIRRLLAPGGVAAIEFDQVLPVIGEGSTTASDTVMLRICRSTRSLGCSSDSGSRSSRRSGRRPMADHCGSMCVVWRRRRERMRPSVTCSRQRPLPVSPASRPTAPLPVALTRREAR